MTPQQAEEKVIELKHREPFVPFVVELNNGETVDVRTRGISVNCGGAGFIGVEGGLMDFEFDQVRAIHLSKTETAA